MPDPHAFRSAATAQRRVRLDPGLVDVGKQMVVPDDDPPFATGGWLKPASMTLAGSVRVPDRPVRVLAVWPTGHAEMMDGNVNAFGAVRLRSRDREAHMPPGTVLWVDGEPMGVISGRIGGTS